MNKKDFSQRLKGVTAPLPGSIPFRSDYNFSVKMKHDGWKLIDFLVDSVPMIPREKWLSKIESGDLKVSGKPTTPDFTVVSGYRLSHTSDEKTDPPVNRNVELIYDDEDMIVVSKPAPLPMHACGRFTKNTLLNFLELTMPRTQFKITHRIDANTTGAVIFAKKKASATKIMRQFEHREVHKEYLALVDGIIEDDSFASKERIGKNTIVSGMRKLCDEGHPAHTEFEVIKRFERENQTLVKAIPKSGRTNQIRLHLAGLGFHIVGDHGYKNTEIMKDRPMTYDDDVMFLHAWKIRIKHPVSGESIEFTANIPDKFPCF